MEGLTEKIEFGVLDESGSISPLILGLFSIALLLSVGILNVSESFLAKRQLIQIGEEVVQRASHSLDYFQYYLGDQSWEPSNKIPLDCNAARDEVVRGISQTQLRGRPIKISTFECQDGLVRVGLHADIAPIIQYPLFRGVSGEGVAIDAEVEAGTYLGEGS